MKFSGLHTTRWMLGMLVLAAVHLGCPAREEAGQARSTIADSLLDEAGMKAAVAEALSSHDTLDRNTAIVDLMRRLDSSNVEGAIAAYEEAASGVDPREVKLFANAWARIDSKAALERLLDFPNPGAQLLGVGEVVFYWTRNGGGAEAREYALASLGKSTGHSESVRETTGNIILDATARGLAAAGEYAELTKLLEALPSNPSRSFLITQSMLELTRVDGEARTWVDGIPWEASNQLKRDVLRPSLALMFQYDAKQASEWYGAVRDRLEPGEFLVEMSETWANREPVESIEWLLSQPESEPRRLALRGAAYIYLKQNGPEASQWIKARLDQPVVKTAMLFPLVQYLISVDIQEALPLAQQIEGRGDKINALKQILMIWSRNDYDAVKAYMADAGVPPEVEKAVRGHNQIRIQRRAAKEAAEQG